MTYLDSLGTAAPEHLTVSEMAGYSREDVSQLRELGIPERTARFALEVMLPEGLVVAV